ncbi:MAG: peptide chain release factor 1 [SAR324 cluster bacterium]|nr:peptide chain release factor 1 [SAR324 cluster bacterium]
MLEKLKKLSNRYDMINYSLEAISYEGNNRELSKLSKELAGLEPAVKIYQKLLKISQGLADNNSLLLDESDSSMKKMITEDIIQLESEQVELNKQAQILLIAKDPHDNSSTIVEIRAGAGGDEAGLFVADLARMYRKYAEGKGFKVNVLDSSITEIGGFREFIFQIIGTGAYRRFKHEAGTHRVQRVPATEAQGRIHTSTVTVAVLPESEEVEEVVINPPDLKIDTYRSQGAGGQHVNTTDSAVRITHLPTGIVVACQEERSQIKNRAKAMHYLKAKIYEQELERKTQSEASLRKSMVGSGDRSERIRTYNYAQGRISDHRIKLTIYRLEEIMQTGDLEEVVQALLLQEQMVKLQNLDAS